MHFVKTMLTTVCVNVALVFNTLLLPLEVSPLHGYSLSSGRSHSLGSAEVTAELSPAADFLVIFFLLVFFFIHFQNMRKKLNKRNVTLIANIKAGGEMILDAVQP